MPLRLSLKSGERVIVNGTVLRNDGRRTTLTVENHAQILRGKSVMTEDEANTPTKRAYFAIQSMLIDPSSKETGKKAMDFLAGLYAALSAGKERDAVLEAANLTAAGNCYKALAQLRPVIAYEAEVFTRAQSG